MAFYVYRHYLTYPEQLRWIVCEVSATVAAGQGLAQKKGERQLSFTTERDAAEKADIYFTSGALQYIEEPFCEILGRLTHRPPHVLINRVPLCSGPSFITLQK